MVCLKIFKIEISERSLEYSNFRSYRGVTILKFQKIKFCNRLTDRAKLHRILHRLKIKNPHNKLIVNLLWGFEVAGAGLEPMTFGLWARRATNCSIPHYFLLVFVLIHYLKTLFQLSKCNLCSVLIGLQRYNSFLCSPNKITNIFKWVIRQVL